MTSVERRMVVDMELWTHSLTSHTRGTCSSGMGVMSILVSSSYGQVMVMASLLTWGEEQRGPGECLHQQRGEVGQAEAEHQPAHTRVNLRPGHGPGHWL